MNKLVIIAETKPVNGTLTRIIEKFEVSNPILQTGVIKDYVYIDEKRIIA